MPTEELVEKIKADVGESLLTVATYDTDGYEFHYLRDDIQGRYSTAEIQQVYEDLTIQGIGAGYIESMFHAGSLNCVIYGMDDATMFHFVRDDYAGLFISIDANQSVTIPEFVEKWKSILNNTT